MLRTRHSVLSTFLLILWYYLLNIISRALCSHIIYLCRDVWNAEWENDRRMCFIIWWKIRMRKLDEVKFERKTDSCWKADKQDSVWDVMRSAFSTCCVAIGILYWCVCTMPVTSIFYRSSIPWVSFCWIVQVNRCTGHCGGDDSINLLTLGFAICALYPASFSSSSRPLFRKMKYRILSWSFSPPCP